MHARRSARACTYLLDAHGDAREARAVDHKEGHSQLLGVDARSERGGSRHLADLLMTTTKAMAPATAKATPAAFI